MNEITRSCAAAARRPWNPLLWGWLLWPPLVFPHAAVTTSVQFDREIVHILDDRCVMCHEPNGPAFPLVTYEQTYAARWKIRQDVLDRHMTPWAAVPGYGEFANDNSLTQREIDFFVSWAESFGPRNDGQVYTGVAHSTSGPKVVQARVDLDRWIIGTPDMRLTLPASTTGAGQASRVQRVSIDLQLKSDAWLRGLEYQPGDRRRVHEVSFTIEATGQWIGAWTPWYGFISLPEGLAWRLPAGSHLVATSYYPTHSGSPDNPAADPGTVGLYLAHVPSARTITSVSLETKQGAADSRQEPAASRKFVATTRLEGDLNLLAVEPQLSPGVQSIEISARTPGGAPRVLLFARDIPLEWPTPYVYAKPLPLPKGTVVSVVEHYAKDSPDANGADKQLVDAGLPVTFIAYQGTTLPVTPTTGVSQPSRGATTQVPAAPASLQRFKLSGTVKSVDADNGSIVVQHGDIPGFMSAMTMSYRVAPREDLQHVVAGDKIESDIVVNTTTQYLENIKVTGKTK